MNEHKLVGNYNGLWVMLLQDQVHDAIEIGPNDQMAFFKEL